MKERDEYLERTKRKLDEWNAEIDAMEARIRKAEAKSRKGLQVRVNALKAKRDEAASKLEQMRGVPGDSWDAFMKGMERTWEELKTTIGDTKNAFEESVGSETAARK